MTHSGWMLVHGAQPETPERELEQNRCEIKGGSGAQININLLQSITEEEESSGKRRQTAAGGEAARSKDSNGPFGISEQSGGRDKERAGGERHTMAPSAEEDGSHFQRISCRY